MSRSSRRRGGEISEMNTAFIPVRAAGEMLGVSKQRVHQLMQGGQLVFKKVSRTILISARSVEARLALLAQEAEE